MANRPRLANSGSGDASCADSTLDVFQRQADAALAAASTGDDEARRRALQVDHQAYLQRILSGAGPKRVRSSIAGAGSHTEQDRMRVRVIEMERLRRLDAVAAGAGITSQIAAELQVRRATLIAQRAKNAKKRDKDKRSKSKKEASGMSVKHDTGVTHSTSRQDSGSDEEEAHVDDAFVSAD